MLAGPGRWTDAWLIAPEPHAAGRLGLYRIFYALFYLWHLRGLVPANLAGLPHEHDHRMLVNFYLPRDLPPAFYDGLLWLAVAALALLGIGYRTRAATGAVLLFGGLLESCFVDIDLERSTVFLAVHIPLFMLLFGDWGATHSLDAWLRRRRGLAGVGPDDHSPRFVLPIRATLVVLAALFFSAGVWKLAPGSEWFREPHYFSDLTLRRYVEAALYGLPLHPLPLLFREHPLLDLAIRCHVIAFELSFPLALLSARLRDVYLSLALLFHALNGIWLGVTFTTILVVYPLFVDGEALRRRLPAGLGIGAALGFALWLPWLDPVTIWYPVLPIAAAAVALSLFRAQAAARSGVFH